MKKLVITGLAAAVMAVAVVTTQTSYACICISGFIWSSECDQIFPPKQVNPPVVRVETSSVPVSKPAVVTVSAAAPAPTPIMELPKTGASDSILVSLLVLGVLTYAGVYTLRSVKRAN